MIDGLKFAEEPFIAVDLSLFRIVDMSDCYWDPHLSSIVIFGGNYSNGCFQRIRF